MLELIGTGATSHVYLGLDPELDRRVALKLLRRDGPDREGWRARFVREGRALASLSHPNVLQVYEIGSEGDEVFLAIELIEGRDLRAWSSEGERSWRDVARVMSAAASGLAAAHDHGLVHRDVKPANVLVDADERVRVADFGLVQPTGTSNGAARPSEGAPSTLTRTGAAVGSPAYMSPEQWTGGEVDARSDQFSLCVTFFEALYGRRPFAGESEADVARAVVEGAVEAPAGSTVPAWLLELVLCGLAREPDERFDDMHAFGNALDSRLAANEHVEHAREALDAIRRDPDAFATHAATASVAVSSALDAWPQSEDARDVRTELLELSFDHDLAQGALDAAAAHLVGLPGRADLEQRLSDARAEAASKDERLAKLRRLEHDADPNVSLDFKVRTLLVQAPLWALVFWGLGAATRAGWLHAGHFAAIVAAHIVSTLLAVRAHPEVWLPNRVARRLIELSVTNQIGTCLMLSYAWIVDIELARAFIFVQLMLTAFWLAASFVLDRRMLFVAFVALVAAVVMHFAPRYAVDAYGVATALALVGLAWTWARQA